MSNVCHIRTLEAVHKPHDFRPDPGGVCSGKAHLILASCNRENTNTSKSNLVRTSTRVKHTSKDTHQPKENTGVSGCLALALTCWTSLGGEPREKKMPKGHLPRVMYHEVYYHTKMKLGSPFRQFSCTFVLDLLFENVFRNDHF